MIPPRITSTEAYCRCRTSRDPIPASSNIDHMTHLVQTLPCQSYGVDLLRLWFHSFVVDIAGPTYQPPACLQFQWLWGSRAGSTAKPSGRNRHVNTASLAAPYFKENERASVDESAWWGGEEVKQLGSGGGRAPSDNTTRNNSRRAHCMSTITRYKLIECPRAVP